MAQSVEGVKTKLCHIVKRADFDGYGFNLHSEKAKPGQFIGKVDANSPAELAGLKEGDRILEVNGQSIEGYTHKQVVQHIKAIDREVRLLLTDGTHLEEKTQMNGNGNGKATTATVSVSVTPLLTNENTNINTNTNPNAISNSSSHDDDHHHQASDHGGGMSQILPGVSENINSITMVSTKRPSQDSQHNNNDNDKNNDNDNDNSISISGSNLLANGHNGTDQVDYSNTNTINNKNDRNSVNEAINNDDDDHDNDNVKMMTTMMRTATNIPPPPSAITANNNMHNKVITINATSTNGNALSKANVTEIGEITTTTSSSATSAVVTTTITTTTTNTINTIEMSAPMTIHKAGSLQLPLTAAEMRAKLMAKKKYDPKNESVDLRKKYEIVQKL